MYQPCQDRATRDPDLIEAFGHYLCWRAGQSLPPDQENPLCRSLKTDRGGRFEDVILLFGVRSYTSSDFGELFAGGLSTLVTRSYQTVAGNVDAVVKNIRVKDFKETQIGLISITNEPSSVSYLQPEAGPIPFAEISLSEATGQVKPYSLSLRFSNHLFVNDDIGAILEITTAASARLGQIPGILFAEILNSNPTVNGTALIAGDNAVGSALDASSLQTAIGILERAHHVPSAYLVCPPDMKATVATLLEAMPALNIQLVSNPWLTSTTYTYLLPAPDTKPVFARLGFQTPPVPEVSKRRSNPGEWYDGQMMMISLDVGFAPMSRALVRIGA